MNRFRRQKVKREKPEPSASHSREVEEHDLAYYIHDRVELMHQVFSVLKHKELRAMAPECVRRISIDDLQELCTEELLGISSKRLCAILDGAEPPSDTESSSQSEPERLETISLDSISSDEEILSQSSKKKKHKHRRDSKSKSKKKRTKSKEPSAPEETEKSKASRAGLTVLELLELQARARAIRAQLQQEQAKKQATEHPAAVNESSASENEVEIKEEAPEVVEISSDEEKPKIEQLEKDLPKANEDLPNANKNGVEATNKEAEKEKEKEVRKSKEKKSKKDKSKKDKKKDKEKENKDKGKDAEKEKENFDLREKIEQAKKNKSPELNKDEENQDKEVENTQKVTKKINNLIITVPKQHSRKIKLNRSKVTVSVANTENVASIENSSHLVSVVSDVKTNETLKPVETTVKSTVHIPDKGKDKQKGKDKSKKKQKKKERKKSSDKDVSDHDEITLQLSDSEKMDLLEDFDRRNLDNVTSSSEDSESSSDSESDSTQDSSKENSFEMPQGTAEEKHNDESQTCNESRNDLNEHENNEVIILESGRNDLNEKETPQGTAEEKNNDESQTCNESRNDLNEKENNEAITVESGRNDLNKKDNNEVIELESGRNYSPDKDEDMSKEVIINVDNFNVSANGNRVEKADSSIQIQSELRIETSSCLQESNLGEDKVTDDTNTTNKIESYISSSNTENNIIISDVGEIPVREDTAESQDNEPDNSNSKESDKASNTDETSTMTMEIDTEQAEMQSQNVSKQTSDENATENMESETIETLQTNTEQIIQEIKSNENSQESHKDLSEGEVSSNESSEVEACELKPEVVCISDEEEDSVSNKSAKKKKNKKKEKKSKKEKKAKKSKSDFREGADQNFYRDVEIHIIDKEGDKVTSENKESVKIGDEAISENKESITIVDDDDVYEILELSDDSSCYEVEGTVLSKEPTAEEIEALSAKIDEIEREDVVTEEQIREHERELDKRKLNGVDNKVGNEENEEEENIENISWKDRYLGSKKVKTVLTTANILNALRKKNKELKKKLEESKKKEEQDQEQKEEIPLENKELEEGSIEHYNTLQGSTKYVNPVPDVTEKEKEATSVDTVVEKLTDVIAETAVDKNIEIQVTGEMKKDAKQLLKMYKKLLKYNDITKPKDPNKKKKKKQKKKEKDAGNVANSEAISQ